MAKVSIDDQIAEVKRELMMRENVYPKLVAAGKAEQNIADMRVRDLAAALRTLEYVRDNREAMVLLHELNATEGALDFVKQGLKAFPGATVKVGDADETRGSEAGSGSLF